MNQRTVEFQNSPCDAVGDLAGGVDEGLAYIQGLNILNVASSDLLDTALKRQNLSDQLDLQVQQRFRREVDDTSSQEINDFAGRSGA